MNKTIEGNELTIRHRDKALSLSLKHLSVLSCNMDTTRKFSEKELEEIAIVVDNIIKYFHNNEKAYIKPGITNDGWKTLTFKTKDN